MYIKTSSWNENNERGYLREVFRMKDAAWQQRVTTQASCHEDDNDGDDNDEDCGDDEDLGQVTEPLQPELRNKVK